MKKSDEIEEAWGEVKQALRKLSDVYKYEYNILYSAVQLKVLEKQIKRDKRIQVITVNGCEFTIGKTADGYLVTAYDEEVGDDLVVGIIK